MLATWPHCVQTAVSVLVAMGVGFLLSQSFAGDPARPGAEKLPAADLPSARLELNGATRAELALVPGLGPARAQAVEDYRRHHGPFRSVEDLRNVPGIGPKTLERVRSYLFVDEVAKADTPPARDASATIVRSAAAKKSKKEAALTAPINVNGASAAELQKLPGIGPKLAQRILDERTLRGSFKTVDELRRVPGIGPKTLEKLRPHVIVELPEAAAGL
jgi:competence protein ComEA